MKTLLLLTACLLGCTSYVPTPTQDGKESAETVVDKYNRVIGACGKFVWFTTDTGTRAYGSAWCVKINDTASWWVSCKHVIKKPDTVFTWVANLKYHNANGYTISIVAPEDIILMDDYDIGVFKVTGIAPLKTLTMSTDLGYLNERLKQDIHTPMLRCGVIDGIDKPTITIGYYLGNDKWGLKSNAGGWMGCSGGPLIDFDTLKVVGVTYGIVRPPEVDKTVSIPITLVSEWIHKQLD
jgi:hypothetical protein